MAINADRFKTINNNVEARTENNGCIKDGQLASYVRCSMENKNLLQNKYDIYVGTGNYITADGESVSRETEGMNIIDALNAATTISGASAININSDKLKVDYSTSESEVNITSTKAVNITSTETIDINGTTGVNLEGQSVDITGLGTATLSADGDLNLSAAGNNVSISAGADMLVSSSNFNLTNNKFEITFGTATTTTTMLKIDGEKGNVILSGNLAIGDSTKWEALSCGEIICSKIDIRGGTTVINNSSVSATTIIATGEITAESFNAKSDARLKTNIKPFDYHNSILDVPVREYDWIKSGEHAIGFVAQELQEVYPELVSEGEDGVLSIKETKLVYLLMEEVKKLRKEVEDLKKEG